MRSHLLALVLIAAAAAPAPVFAQARPSTVEQRVSRLEQQLRAVQRRVFPGGAGQTVEPEIPAEVQAVMGGAPAGDTMTGLIARVDALESQLRALTGQVEEQGNRTRQIEEQVARLRADLTSRIDRLEPAPVQPAPSRPEPAAAAADPPPRTSTPAAGTDAAEEAYNAGFRLWDQRRFADAQAALERAATRHPNSRWTSWMRNLQGRAYLDDNKPATAARILLANYQDNPRGERAADSLYYLGQALTRLNRRAEACRVYDELAQVYPNMRDFVRTRLPEARTAARCN
jgi:TolA-binding protein